MKSLFTVLFLAAATAVNAGAPAKNPVQPIVDPACPPLNYNFAELGWIHQDSSLGKNDGGYLDLSYQPFGNFLIGATGTVAGGDWDYNEIGANIGYILPLSDQFHFNLRAGWALFDTDLGSSVNEFYLQPGVRWQVTCKFELFAKAYYHVPEFGENNWSGGVGAVYHLCPKSALVVGAGMSQDDDSDDDAWLVQAGIRFAL